MPADRERVSKLMSLMLRHRPHDHGLAIDRAGWVSVGDLLAALARAGTAIDEAELAAIVRTSDKQRFAIELGGDGVATRIRANQGHSIDVVLDLAPAAPPGILYHGTVARFLPAIRARGLLRGRRHHVHLSATEDTARAVGARRGDAVVLRVRASAMTAAGHAFFVTPNGVWLTDHVPPEFLDEPGVAAL